MHREPAGAADQRDPSCDADAIVVGSGFGGAVTACRLVQAGLSVLIVERGRRYEAGDFPNLPASSTLLPDQRRWWWQRDRGLWDALDLEDLVAIQAAGYGGGSLLYANVHLRPPPEVFDDAWPSAYRGGSALEPFYDLAAHMLEAEPVSAHPEFGNGLVKADQLRRAARHLGREAFHPPLAIRYADGQNLHGVARSACDRCGSCCTGCPRGAKNTLDATYLALAERHGARVMTQCEVRGLRHVDAERWELRCIDHLSAVEVSLRSRYVFLCAGSVHTTRLLARAHLPEGARATQALVGRGYFPGGDAVGIVYDTEHEQFPSFGPTITTALMHRDAEDPGSFFLVEDGGYGNALERIMGMLRAPAFVGANRLTRAGRAEVERSPIPRPPPPARPTAPASGPPPPLDAVLDALALGDFRKVVSPEVRRAASSFVDELKFPLLVPVLVDATIARALRERYRRSWLLRRLDPDGPLLRLVTRIVTWLVHRTLGDPAQLGDHALRAMLSGGDLDRAAWGRHVLGLDAAGAERRAMLLCMGRDAAPGVLHHDVRSDRVVARLDRHKLASGYASEEQLMTDIARALGGELRTNPVWAFLGKPITVHSQGGCPMSDSEDLGVTTDEGQVRRCRGLYVSDGAILSGSVGTNPSATIMAIAERNVLAFIRKLKGSSWPDGDTSQGAVEYRRQRDGARAWARRAHAAGWSVGPPPGDTVPLTSHPLGLSFHEEMEGYYEPTMVAPEDDAGYRGHESRGCPEFPLKLELDVSVENLSAFYEDERHRMQLDGTVTLRMPGAERNRESAFPARGWLELLVPSDAPLGIRAARHRGAPSASTTPRLAAVPDDADPSRQRLMRYVLSFSDSALQEWWIQGFKRIGEQPRIDAWRATSSLYCQLHGPFSGGSAQPSAHATVRGAGVVHVDLTTFLFRQLPSMRISASPLPAAAAGAAPGDDPARTTWALVRFASFFFGTLQRIYMPELGSALEAMIRRQPERRPESPSPREVDVGQRVARP